MEAKTETKPEQAPTNQPESNTLSHTEHHKKEKGEHHEKKPRAERPKRENEYEYNADNIDENTVIQPLPKKNEIIPKPDIKTYKERETKNTKRIEEIINKKVKFYLMLERNQSRKVQIQS